MLELRVLNGLHRGAAIALDGETLTIGSRESSDIVLIDPGIEAQHATIECHAGIWCVAPAKGQVRAESGQVLKEPLEIAEGLRLLLGGVWIGFAHETAPWSSLEPLPAVPALDDTAAEESAVGEAAAAPVAKKAAPGARQKKMKRSMMLRIGGIVGLGSVVATWTLANAFSPDKTPAPAPAPLSSAAQALASVRTAPAIAVTPKTATKGAEQGKNQVAVPPLPGGVPTVNAPKAAPEKPAKPTREELAAAFTGLLIERDLARRVHVTTRADGWLVEGDLDEEERQRFERALAKFEAEYDPPFPIRTKFVSAANLLPFKIVAVVGGRTPRIITSRGENLFVGQELHGYRLVSIEGNKLTFDGKRKLQVTW